jgi:hypothetical protein
MALLLTKSIQNDDVSYWLIDEVRYDKAIDRIEISLGGYFDAADRVRKFPMARSRARVAIPAQLSLGMADAYAAVKAQPEWAGAQDV